MILVHLSTNGKSAIVDPTLVMFAEDCSGEKDNEQIRFTRMYLKQPLPGENETSFIDVQENVEKILKAIK